MGKFMLGKKAGMTQLFAEDGTAIPATVIDCGPVVVVQKKTQETDGYDAVKVGYGDVSEQKLNKPDRGQYAKAEIKACKVLREFHAEEDYSIGQQITVADMFKVGDAVDVSGQSKGKGFAGVVKRYGQKIGPMTHGSMYHRRVGSMGPTTNPGRVYKGKRLPGHMGAAKVTVQNLDVVMVDAERNILVVKGAVPGSKGNVVEICTSVKSH